MEYTIEKTTSHEGHSFLWKNDTLSLNTAVILFFFEVKFMHVFVKYCLGVWENDFTDISWQILALNISRDNKIGICPNYLRVILTISYINHKKVKCIRNKNFSYPSQGSF